MHTDLHLHAARAHHDELVRRTPRRPTRARRHTTLKRSLTGSAALPATSTAPIRRA